MRKQNLLYLFLLTAFAACSPEPGSRTETSSKKPENADNVHTIAFGSCNRQDKPQPLWPFILEEKPDVWIWLGDNIYGDTRDMAVLKGKYEVQKKQPEYSKLRASTKITGIWDDHDFGINDGGTHYTKKDSSQMLMLDFLDEPAQSPRRKQAGAYTSYEYGSGENAVKIFLLDARYHRDTLYRENGQYLPNREGTILGETQWKWLEEGLKNSTARINLIASGIQFIPEEHPYEKWANFPAERQKLLNLIASSGVKNPVLLSGDRHIGEVSKIQLNDTLPLHEITCSGLTHTWKEYKDEPNRYREGKLIVALHYGVLNIDWEGKIMDFALKGENGEVFLNQKIGIKN